MKITLLYNGDNDGLTYPPIFPLMLGNELAKLGFAVEITQDEECYDYLGVPSDSIYREEYQDLIKVINALKDTKLEYEELEVLYDCSPDFNVAGVLTSIGCMYKCKLCPQSKMGFMERPLDIVIKELDWITSRYPYFEFLDNNILTNLDRMIEITNHVPRGVKWGALINLERYDREKMLRLRANGCVNLYAGVESFNPADLEFFSKPYYHKGINPKDSLTELLDLGFNLHVFVIRALPNETKEEFKAMLDWFKLMGISYTISRLSLDSGYVFETEHLSLEYLAEKFQEDKDVSSKNLKQFINRQL